jgi:hypothetical protein
MKPQLPSNGLELSHLQMARWCGIYSPQPKLTVRKQIVAFCGASDRPPWCSRPVTCTSHWGLGALDLLYWCTRPPVVPCELAIGAPNHPYQRIGRIWCATKLRVPRTGSLHNWCGDPVRCTPDSPGAPRDIRVSCLLIFFTWDFLVLCLVLLLNICKASMGHLMSFLRCCSFNAFVQNHFASCELKI